MARLHWHCFSPSGSPTVAGTIRSSVRVSKPGRLSRCEDYDLKPTEHRRVGLGSGFWFFDFLIFFCGVYIKRLFDWPVQKIPTNGTTMVSWLSRREVLFLPARRSTLSARQLLIVHGYYFKKEKKKRKKR